MCIRDRLWILFLPRLKLRKEFALEIHRDVHPEQELLVALFSACLLYTSDAADERSSVDLGGRRIIKKKKNEARGERWREYDMSKIR